MLAAGLFARVLLQVFWGQGMDAPGLEWVAIISVLLLNVVGIWMVTRREPAVGAAERALSLRRIVRWSALAATLVFVATPLLGVRAILFDPSRSAISPAGLASSSVMCVVFFLLALHVGSVAGGAGRKRLAILWRIVGGLGLASGLLCFGSPARFTVAPDGEQIGRLSALLAMVLPVGVAMMLIALLVGTAWALGKSKE